ncbi:MAG: hypothetical protein JWQ98_373 [Chlorobi bacterium]|nr:hypothetical protein [Chlorobiota bacterium]
MPNDLDQRVQVLEGRFDQLIQQLGDEISPFPPAGVDGFLSHFIMTIEFLQGDLSGKSVSVQFPPSIQTVVRSEPFIYQGADEGHVADLTLPANCTLPSTISESDFIERPDEFFVVGQETVWLQILNLDSRVEIENLGSVRVILGETLKREYPDLFVASLGVAQSLGPTGFPAKLFFNPYAIIETDLGPLRAIHGTLSYGRITAFPPLGTPVTLNQINPLESVSAVRARIAAGDKDALTHNINQPDLPARIVALSHPIDVSLLLSGDDVFNFVEHAIDNSAAG